MVKTTGSVKTEENSSVIAVPVYPEGVLGYLKHPKKRVWEIDFLRGFCVLLMILDHTTLLLSSFFGPEWYGGLRAMSTDGSFGARLCTLCLEYWNSGLREVGHPIVLFIFFSISGISCAFSRSNLKRGLQLAVISGIYTLGSYIAEEVVGVYGVFVAFGVLHFYAVCILIWAAICGYTNIVSEKRIFGKKNVGNLLDDTLANKNISVYATIIKTLVSAAIVITVLGIYHCYVAPADTPEWLFFLFPYANPDGTSSTFYYINAISPGDLFNLIPWSAFFFFGTFIQPLIYPKKRSLLPKLDRAWHKPLSFLGRHALLVYVLHIFLVAGLLMLISQIAFGTWGLF